MSQIKKKSFRSYLHVICWSSSRYELLGFAMDAVVVRGHVWTWVQDDAGCVVIRLDQLAWHVCFGETRVENRILTGTDRLAAYLVLGWPRPRQDSS
jgi:hypothetical protein